MNHKAKVNTSNSQKNFFIKIRDKRRTGTNNLTKYVFNDKSMTPTGIETTERERKDKNSEGNNSLSGGNNEDLFKDLQYPNLIKEEDLKFLEESANRPSLLSILQSIGIDENLANNLFTDFELNKNELETMIKKDIEEKLLKSDNNTNINPIQNNNINTIIALTKF